MPVELVEKVVARVNTVENIGSVRQFNPPNGHVHIALDTTSQDVRQKVLNVAKELVPEARLI
jgi:hypothetical protein